MTLKKIVTKLRSEGYKVGYKRRADGGLDITSIEGIKFKGREGNKQARMLAGASLTQAQAKQRAVGRVRAGEVRQREAVSRAKAGITAARRKTATKLSKRVRSAITQANRALRGTAVKSRVSARKIRQAIRRGESEKSILRRLRETRSHAEGKAYQAEIDKWEAIFRSYGWEAYARLIEKHRAKFTAAHTSEIRAIMYGRESAIEKKQHIAELFVRAGITQAEIDRAIKKFGY